MLKTRAKNSLFKVISFTMFRVSEKNGGGGAMVDSKRAPVTIS